MSKNKKKTAREKRILVGAFLTAVVIAAGSTFAWFTSTDTVTNRLSANADYNVSVIETFTPPANWLPGEKVNKDTSAINTGNIDAFVKQKLEGVMQVTVEHADKDFDANKAVELTPDEVDVIEAGGFLAYAFDGNTKIGVEKGTALGENQCLLGEISAVHSKNNENGEDLFSDVQFVPPATGDYIFRREIEVSPLSPNPDASDLDKVSEKYEYVGYHYDATTGKYYKIKNLNALQPKEDGILAQKPVVYYAVEKQEAKKLPLRYEASLTRNYISYTSNGSTFKKEYTEKETVEGPGEGGSYVTYTKYTLVEGGYIYVDEAKKVYNGVTPSANEIGASADEIQETTPTRLVATYTVDKSEDVFIDAGVNPAGTDNRTDLSNPTATEYDNELTAIAKSDYLIAKAAYDTAYNQYILNKNAYEAGVALLTAIAQNENTLKTMMDAIVDVRTNEKISELALNDGADPSAAVFTTEVGAVNTALGSTGVTNGDINTVGADDTTALRKAVAKYAALPNETNWQAVVGAYEDVEEAFTGANGAIDALERAIVNAWNDAKPTGLTDLNTLAQVATADITAANVSPAAKAAKAAAAQLITWEATLQTYQNDIAAYYAELAGIHADSQYKLQPVTDLEKAYEAAAGAHADSYSTDATFDNTVTPPAQTERATEITTTQDGLSVEDDYKIKVGTDAKDTLALNAGLDAPIKDAISEDGYASGTAIENITGNTQFTINGNAVGSSPVAPAAPDKEAYTTATNEYNKYQTTQTNQAANNDIVIYINLANITDGSEAAKWKLTPTLNPGDTEANFYYTSILKAGDISSILVDSVELSGDTTNTVYKDFDFDLNVTVDSAQVVMSDDGTQYLPTAVNGLNATGTSAFGAKPTKTEYSKDGSSAVDWN